MSTLTRLVLRHKALVVLFWAMVAAAGIMTLSGTTHRMTNSFSMPGQAFRVDGQILRLYGNGGAQAPYIPVVTLPAGQKVTDPVTARQTGAVFGAIRAQVPGVRVADYANTHNPVFVAHNSRTTYALVYVPPQNNFKGSGSLNAAISRAVSGAAPKGWHIGVTGSDLLAAGKPAAASKGTGMMAEAMIGSLGALAVLAVVFASFLAFLPLVIGLVSVLATFLVVSGLTEITGVSQIVEFLIALVGLGVAIDYSLLVVSRWREERTRDSDNEAAVVEAMAHAGRAVVFSGLTVAIGLASMIVLPVPMLRSVGYGGLLVPLMSVVVALTLLPVVLATIGPRLDWPRIRTERKPSRVFASWAGVVYRHRWVAAIGGLTVMVALMAPALSLRLGEPGAAAEATSGPAHDAFVTLTAGAVPAGVLTPIEILVTANPGVVAAAAGRVSGVDAAFAPAGADYRRAGTAIVTAIPAVESNLSTGQAIVSRLEKTMSHEAAVAGVGGDGAAMIDFEHAVYGHFPLMLSVIALATFLLLCRAFRSVLLAAKAVVFNLISLGASYGALTWVWQDGHGSSALWGVPATGTITMWVPLMVFTFLFGLSMDYEVFILTRIREAYDRGADARAAVIEGLGRTGRLVTGAAAILMLSFLSMSTGPMTDIKILATGLGAGILIDAVVVRCLLVPAMVALFGKANWWMPAVLSRALKVSLPGPPPAGAAALPGALVVTAKQPVSLLS